MKATANPNDKLLKDLKAADACVIRTRNAVQPIVMTKPAVKGRESRFFDRERIECWHSSGDSKKIGLESSSVIRKVEELNRTVDYLNKKKEKNIDTMSAAAKSWLDKSKPLHIANPVPHVARQLETFHHGVKSERTFLRPVTRTRQAVKFAQDQSEKIRSAVSDMHRDEESLYNSIVDVCGEGFETVDAVFDEILAVVQEGVVSTQGLSIQASRTLKEIVDAGVDSTIAEDLAGIVRIPRAVIADTVPVLDVAVDLAAAVAGGAGGAYSEVLGGVSHVLFDLMSIVKDGLRRSAHEIRPMLGDTLDLSYFASYKAIKTVETILSDFYPYIAEATMRIVREGRDLAQGIPHTLIESTRALRGIDCPEKSAGRLWNYESRMKRLYVERQLQEAMENEREKFGVEEALYQDAISDSKKPLRGSGGVKRRMTELRQKWNASRLTGLRYRFRNDDVTGTGVASYSSRLPIESFDSTRERRLAAEQEQEIERLATEQRKKNLILEKPENHAAIAALYNEGRKADNAAYRGNLTPFQKIEINEFESVVLKPLPPEAEQEIRRKHSAALDRLDTGKPKSPRRGVYEATQPRVQGRVRDFDNPNEQKHNRQDASRKDSRERLVLNDLAPYPPPSRRHVYSDDMEDGNEEEEKPGMFCGRSGAKKEKTRRNGRETERSRHLDYDEPEPTEEERAWEEKLRREEIERRYDYLKTKWDEERVKHEGEVARLRRRYRGDVAGNACGPCHPTTVADGEVPPFAFNRYREEDARRALALARRADRSGNEVLWAREELRDRLQYVMDNDIAGDNKSSSSDVISSDSTTEPVVDSDDQIIASEWINEEARENPSDSSSTTTPQENKEPALKRYEK